MKKLMWRIAVAVLILCGACNICTIDVDAYSGLENDAADGTYKSSDEKYSLEYQYINGGTELSIVGYAIDDVGTAVIIPSEIEGKKVKNIEWGLFWGCPNITSVTIPDTVSEIDAFTFANCKELETINIPASVTTIGRQAFVDTKWLANRQKENPLVVVNNMIVDGSTCTGNITIPSGITAICAEAFCIGDLPVIEDRDWCYEPLDNDKLTGVTCNSELKSIGASAFENCVALTDISFNSGLVSIDAGAFGGCSKLTSVTIPEGVTEIGQGAFVDCTQLAEVSLPDSIKEIGVWPFGNTIWLKDKEKNSENGLIIEKHILLDGTKASGNVVIPDTVTVISEYAFCMGTARENTALTGVDIKGAVEVIPEDTFAWCTNLTSVSLPDTVTDIEKWAFKSCTSLAEINIPDGVTGIGDGAFEDCTVLKDIKLPVNVTEMGLDAFSGCTNLTAINVSEDNQSYSSAEGVLYDKNKTKLITYPAGKGGVYTVPETVTTISSGAFDNCDNLKEVILSPKLSTVSATAFGTDNSEVEDDKKIKVTVPEEMDVCGVGLENIEATNRVIIYVAEGSSADLYLEEFKLQITVVTYPSKNGTKKDTKEENGTKEPDKKIDNNKKDSEQSVPAGEVPNNSDVTTEENNNSSLPAAEIGKTYEVDNVTYKVTSATEVTFIAPKNKNIKKLTIPAVVTIMNKSYNVTAVSKGACKGYKKLATVTVGSNVKSIGDEAFMNCAKLNKVTVGKNVTSIGKKAFSGDKKLKKLIFKGANVKKIGKKALSKVPKKVKITAPKKAVSKYKKLLNKAK